MKEEKVGDLKKRVGGRFPKMRVKKWLVPVVGLLVSGWLMMTLVGVSMEKRRVDEELSSSSRAYEEVVVERSELEARVASAEARLAELEARDEYVINQELEGKLDEIKKAYGLAVKVYESLVEFGDQGGNGEELESEFADGLWTLSRAEYEEAGKQLAAVETKISAKQAELAAAAAAKAAEEAAKALGANVATNNNPPGSGYSRQKVATSVGEFVVDLVAGDLASSRAYVVTASEGDCGDGCSVKAVGSYAAENGAYAAINGSYFCPASYPSCAGKTNSFDTLAMNRNKVYFNSDNNVYSNVPAVIFGDGWVRFVGRSMEWGRDTSVDGVLANQPLLVSGGQSVFGGDGDPKKGVKSGRSFVANKGSIVYIGVVRNATVAEAAIVLATLGMENGLNLDSGGSTALWYGGYKAGPGRNVPNAIVLVRK